MPQYSIPLSPSIAYAGQMAEPFPIIARSFLSEGDGLVSGQIVKRGTDPNEQVEALEAGDEPSAASIAGVVIFSSSKALTDDGTIDDDTRISVLRFGSIYMEFSEAVTAGEQVGVTLASGLLTGVPHGTAAGALATGIVVIPCMRIASTIAAAGMAIVEVNLFGSQDAATVGSL